MGEYYSLRPILSKGATYNVIFGERSNGKTYAALVHALEKYVKDGSQAAIIRRWDEDFIGADSARTCFDSLIYNGKGENAVEKITKGKYTGVEYYAKKFYLTSTDENGKSVRSDDVVAIAFSISGQEHVKSASFPNIRTIIFDEFITRSVYLRDEFVMFQNLLSTIIRRRDDVEIFMLANTVSKFACPYFTEMGLYRIKDMRQGEIDVYTYGTSGLTVAVEWVGATKAKKPSDKYFAFENPHLQMIKTGSWEMDIYPHCPRKYLPRDIMFTFFVVYEEITVQCEAINVEGEVFLFMHRKTTPIKNDDDLVFSREASTNPYVYPSFKAAGEIGRKIEWFFTTGKAFYQDNEIGELMRAFMMTT